jgi:DNA-binding NtrC family response regulator
VDVLRELARRPPVVVAATEAPAAGGLPIAGEAGAGTLEATRRDAEREAIVIALAKSGNNRVMAARVLGISRRGLYHKLGEYGLL